MGVALGGTVTTAGRVNLEVTIGQIKALLWRDSTQIKLSYITFEIIKLDPFPENYKNGESFQLPEQFINLPEEEPFVVVPLIEFPPIQKRP